MEKQASNPLHRRGDELRVGSFPLAHLATLLVLMAGGAGVASLGLALLGRSFAVDVQLPINVSAGMAYNAYNDAEPSLASPEIFAQFARSRGISDSPEAKQFQEQLARRAPTISFQHQFGVSRASIRDVPDEIAKDISKDAGASKIIISAKMKSPEQAVKMAELGLSFLRTVLVQRALQRHLHDWRNVEARLAKLDGELVGRKAEIASLNRSIAEMSRLRDSSTSEVSSPDLGRSQIQVQVNGPTYLPPAQQLIGLQSRRIHEQEALKKVEDKVLRLQTYRSFSATLASITSSEPDPLKALASTLAEARGLRSQATETPQQSAADTVLSDLATDQTAYVDSESNPVHLLARVVGFDFPSAAGLGAASGAAVWVLLLYFSLLWRPQRETGDGDAALPKEELGSTARTLRPVSPQYDSR